jgi:hypothetical protein
VLHERLLVPPFDRPPIEETEVRAVAGVDSLVLRAEAALLRGSCHAVSTLARPGVQWIADAWHLLSRVPSLDWDRLLAQASDEARAVTLGGVLRCLVRDLGADVPDVVLRKLERPSGFSRRVTVRGAPFPFRVVRGVMARATALRRRASR